MFNILKSLTKYILNKGTINSSINLLTYLRFDITAKTLYGRHREKKVEDVIAKKIYFHHLYIWNGYNEVYPLKSNKSDFIDSFNKILDFSKKKANFSNLPRIYLNHNKQLINGSHRTASAIIFNKKLKYEIKPDFKGQIDCSSNYFKNKKDISKKGIKKSYLDLMALEYSYLKKSVYMLTLYEYCFDHFDFINNLLKQYQINIVHEKIVPLTTLGKINYIINLYFNESWIGDKNNNFIGAFQKSEFCFAGKDQVKVLLVETKNIKYLKKVKSLIRTFIDKGKHSIHSTDTIEETWRNATSVFHQPTINFLNKSKLGSFHDQNIRHLINQTKMLMNLNEIDKEDYCIGGSAILNIYGLRECNDFDILHYPTEKPFKPTNKVSSHNGYLNFYDSNLKQMVYDPSKYIYVDGLKFLDIEEILRMKKNRMEQKDLDDIKLIKNLN